MNITRMLGCGLLMGVMLVGAEDHGDKSLAARVQRLEDQEEIRMLLVNYGRSLDARDFPNTRACSQRTANGRAGSGRRRARLRSRP